MFCLTLKLAAQDISLAELLLLHLGALSTSLVEPPDSLHQIYEPPLGTHPLWPEAVLIAHFERSPDIAFIHAGLKNVLKKSVVLASEELADEDWQAIYQKQFNPQVIGDSLRIHAPWHEPCDLYPYQLRISPGIAFGTGTHPTTRLCLQWMVEHPVQQQSFLDFGCGSGILALAAHALGALEIHALDIDPQALTATQANITLNQYPDDCFRLLSDEQQLDTRFDLIVANILYVPLASLCARFADLLQPRGQLVVSGLLQEQMEDLAVHYRPWFECSDRRVCGDWGLLQFRPKQ